jgi:hypothetical protein
MSRIAMISAAAAMALAAGAADAQQAPSSSPEPQRPGAMAGSTAPNMPGPRHGSWAMRMMHGDDDDASWGRGRHGAWGGGHERMGPHMMIMMMAMIDTDGSGTLSLDEIQAVHARLFKYADTDGNGELTIEEIGAFMRGGPGMAEQ